MTKNPDDQGAAAEKSIAEDELHDLPQRELTPSEEAQVTGGSGSFLPSGPPNSLRIPAGPPE